MTIRNCDLSTLLSHVTNTDVSALALSAVATQTCRDIRHVRPPERLPPLVCELGALSVDAIHLPPYHGIVLRARDAQPIKFGNIRVQREFYAMEVINNLDVDISFPVLGVPGKQHQSAEIEQWKKSNIPLIKKNFERYINASLVFVEQHWEYNVLSALLPQFERLAGIHRDIDECRRLLTVLHGTAQMKKRFRESAGTLTRAPK